MTRYLKQQASFEAVSRDANGDPTFNEYGEPSYLVPTTVKCRKERYTAKAAETYGQFTDAKYTYYLDETVTPRPDDKLDGEVIISVNQYVDGLGVTVGYEVQI